MSKSSYESRYECNNKCINLKLKRGYPLFRECIKICKENGDINKINLKIKEICNNRMKTKTGNFRGRKGKMCSGFGRRRSSRKRSRRRRSSRKRSRRRGSRRKL